MAAVRIIVTVIFILFSFFFLATAFDASQKGKDGKTVTTFIIGTTLALLAYAIWLF